MFRWLVWVVLSGIVLAGCADPYRKSEGDRENTQTARETHSADSSNVDSASHDAESPADKADQAEVDARQRTAIERVYGELDLGDFSELTPKWIRENLDPAVVQRAVGTDSSWSVSESVTGDIVFEMADQPRPRRVRISIPLANSPENMMMMQAGVGRDMVKSGKAESVDVEVPGVVAFVSKKSPSELNLYTRDRLIVIDMARAGGDESGDSLAKKNAAVEIARALLNRYRQTHERDSLKKGEN